MERAPVNFSAGVEFIDENGGGPGVRLRKPPDKNGNHRIATSDSRATTPWSRFID
jgi:hypothetical protein